MIEFLNSRGNGSKPNGPEDKFEGGYFAQTGPIQQWLALDQAPAYMLQIKLVSG